MDINILLQNMSPQVYDKLRESVETGKWLDGSPLSDSQRETCMHAVMMYQAKVLKSEQHMSVGADGEIIHKSRDAFKQELQPHGESGSQKASVQDHQHNTQTIARFKQDDI